MLGRCLGRWGGGEVGISGFTEVLGRWGYQDSLRCWGGGGGEEVGRWGYQDSLRCWGGGDIRIH